MYNEYNQNSRLKPRSNFGYYKLRNAPNSL